MDQRQVREAFTNPCEQEDEDLGVEEGERTSFLQLNSRCDRYKYNWNKKPLELLS